MGHIIAAQKTSYCSTCGEQVIPNDQIRLQGRGTGLLHIKGGSRVIGGRSSHVDCAPDDEIHAPTLSWEQAENLLEIVQGANLPTDNVNVRRLIATCKAVKHSRHLAVKKGPTDPALPMSEPFMEAYRIILRLTHHGGEWWRPYDVLKGERWYPQQQTTPESEPERKSYSYAEEQARRARVAEMRERFQRRA